MLKQDIELKRTECDLKGLVSATLGEFKSNLKADLKQDLQPVPKHSLIPSKFTKF